MKQQSGATEVLLGHEQRLEVLVASELGDELLTQRLKHVEDVALSGSLTHLHGPLTR